MKLADGRTFNGKRANTDGVIKGARLAHPVGVMARYAAELVARVRIMTRTTEREITELFKHPDVQDYLAQFSGATAIDISPASQSRILTNKLKDHFEQLFASTAKDDATTMVDGAARASAADVNRSLREISKDFELSTKVLTSGPMREIATATVAQNVSLIKSIASEYLTDVQGAVLRSITDGKGLADLVPFFAEQEGITERRAKNIALDQTRKAYNGFNKARMQQVGVQSFEWVHSGGGLHPRPLHQDRLNGRIFSFDKLPIIDERTGERGIPGQAVNCGCTMVPVVKMQGVKSNGNAP